MKQKIIHPISFTPVVKTWSREKFIRQLSAQFPDHDIVAYADAFGLISEAVAPEAPPAIPSFFEGGEAPATLTIIQEDEPVEVEENTATSSDKTSNKRKGGKK